MQEPVDVTITLPRDLTRHRFYTPISLQLDRINLASPEIRARTSAVVVGRLNHHAIIYRRMANSRVPTKLGVLSVVPSSVSTKLGLLSLSLLPRHWFSTKYSHGSPFHSHRGFPSPPRDPHTGSSRRSHPFLTVCPHTPAPPSPHHQSLPFCKSQLTSPIHNLMISSIICTGHFRGSETE